MSPVRRKVEFGQTLHGCWLMEWEFWYSPALQWKRELWCSGSSPLASAVLIPALDVVVPQWISCSCTCVSRIKQSLCSHCQVILRNLPLAASCPTALCLVSEDCSWPSSLGIEAVSAEPFNSLSHLVLFSRKTIFQTHTGLCNEALMFSRNGNS